MSLTKSQVAEIKAEFGPLEFKRFTDTLVGFAQAFNSQAASSGVDKFDVSQAESDTTDGIIEFRNCIFEFGLDASGEGKSDIVYRFRTRDYGAAPKSPLVTGEETGDPRNTPMMRYQSDVLGTDTEVGKFAFYWDGETTEELAESLLREFIEWVE